MIAHQSARSFLSGLVIVAAASLGSAAQSDAAPTTMPAPVTAAHPADHIGYLDNGQVRVGVNLDLGGAITFLAKSERDANIVNSWDWGRQIQMSFYAGPIPFTPGGKQPAPVWRGLGWNPIQCGDHFKNRASIIDYRNDGKSIYIKAIPMQWPLDNVPGECSFESTLSLENNTVHVSGRLLNQRSDATQFSARGQELPAVYSNGPWWRIMTYIGDKPFTGDAVSQMPAVFPWTSWRATENWTALVNDQNQGMGLWEPGVCHTGGGFAGKPGAGGPKDNPTGYFAPNHIEILDHNIDYGFSYVLIVGSLDDIRKYVYDHAAKPTPPMYHFEKDRQHWFYVNATDAGWPIAGQLDIQLNKAPQLIGPFGLWQSADAPKLYIEAAFEGAAPVARVRWATFAEPNFSEDKTQRFDVTPDGAFHVYEVDLSKSPKYVGAITRLRLDPVSGPGGHGHVRIKSIGYARPEMP